MKSDGFTLIELLLVVLIIALAVGLAVPRFAGSLKGAQMRDAVRTVVRLHSFARSSAVLDECECALLFDVARGTITLISLPKDEEVSGFLDAEREDSIFTDDRDDTGDAEGGSIEADIAQISEKIDRSLPEGISIDNFECDVEGQEIDGIFWIHYFPNGMCDPYSLSVVDPERDASAHINVDSVSGRIEVEYE